MHSGEKGPPEHLLAAARALGVELDSRSCGMLCGYVQMLRKWNRTHNLISRLDMGDIWARHILDSLAVLPHLGGASRIADIGSGAGLPGLPLSIVNPAQSWTLVESRAKRCAFMEQVRLQLGLQNVRVQHLRAEDCNPGEPFMAIICRALASPAPVIKMAGHLMAPGGSLYMMAAAAEPEGLPDSHLLHSSIRLQVPGRRRWLWRIVSGG